MSRSFFCTCNNWTDEHLSAVKAFPYTVMTIASEVGDEKGTPHLHAVFTLKNTMRLFSVRKKLPHWDVRIRAAQTHEEATAYFYETKNKIAPVIIFDDDRRRQGARNELVPFVDAIAEGMDNRTLASFFPREYLRYRKMIQDVRTDFFDPRTEYPTVYWLYGPTGVKKSTYIREKYPAKDVWWSARDLKYWPGYQQHKVAVFDDFRKDFCTFHELLRILDCNPYTVYTFYGTCPLNSPIIYITCPYPPHVLYKTREDVYQLVRRCSKIFSCTILEDQCQLEDVTESVVTAVKEFPTAE